VRFTILRTRSDDAARPPQTNAELAEWAARQPCSPTAKYLQDTSDNIGRLNDLQRPVDPTPKFSQLNA
jgi:hypothetical protein